VKFVGSIATSEVRRAQCVTSPVPVNKSRCSAVPYERYKLNQNPKPRTLIIAHSFRSEKREQSRYKSTIKLTVKKLQPYVETAAAKGR
jgi:hypothetical protein